MSSHIVFRLTAAIRDAVARRMSSSGSESRIVRRDVSRYYSLLASALPHESDLPWEAMLPRLKETFPVAPDHHEHNYQTLIVTLPTILAHASPDAMREDVYRIAEGWSMLQRAAVIDAIEQLLNADPEIPVSDRLALIGLRAWH